MAQVLYQKPGAPLVKLLLPNYELAVDQTLALMLENDRLPFVVSDPHLLLVDEHPACAVPASRLDVDFNAGTVTILPEPVVDPTLDEYTAAIDAHIDATAKAKAYGGAVSLASYVNSTIPQWKAEAEAFVAWRDAVWVYAYEQMALVIAGQRTAPTVAGIVSELPVIEWPA